jgi:hypothetical protein
VDPRISRHPGLGLPLERKLELAAEAVRALGSERPVVPLRVLAAACLRAVDPAVELAATESA